MPHELRERDALPLLARNGNIYRSALSCAQPAPFGGLVRTWNCISSQRFCAAAAAWARAGTHRQTSCWPNDGGAAAGAAQFRAEAAGCQGVCASAPTFAHRERRKGMQAASPGLQSGRCDEQHNYQQARGQKGCLTLLPDSIEPLSYPMVRRPDLFWRPGTRVAGAASGHRRLLASAAAM